MSKTYKQYKLNLPVEMHSSIQEVAELNRRSMSQEIIYRLEAYEAPIANAKAAVRKLGDTPHNIITATLEGSAQ